MSTSPPENAQASQNETQQLLQKLLASVTTLEKEVTALKADDGQRSHPQKRPRDGDGDGENSKRGEDASRDGDNNGNRDSDLDPSEDETDLLGTGSDGSRFQLSEEGEAFLEATCGSRLEYATRKSQATKYGQPDSKWTTCPTLSPVVEATLPKDAVKEDKGAYRSQLMYMEALAPLAACLEKASDDQFTIREAIPMIQSAIMLLGDAAQHHSSLRRKAIMKHLNPQLQALMKEADFKGAQPRLFGEDFGEKAKAKLEAAAALKKSIYPSSSKSKQTGFRGGHPRRNNWGRQGGRPNHYGPGRSSRKDQGPTSSRQEKNQK